MCLIVVSEGEERDNRTKMQVEELTAETFPKIIKYIN